MNMTELNHAMLTKVLDHSICGVYLFSLREGRNLYINDEYTRITGWSLAEINSMDAETFMNLFHPDDKALVQAHMAEVLACQDMKPYELEYRFKHKLGHWVWCLSRDQIFSRDDKGVEQFIGSFIDVSSLKAHQAELTRMNAEIVEKNIQLEQFSYSISHDLRSPLVSIMGFTHSLAQLQEGSEVGEKHIRQIQRVHVNAKIMSNMLADVLTLSRIQRQDIVKTPCPIREIISKVLLRFSDNERACVQVKPADDGEIVLGCRPLIEQALQNLLSNAFKFALPERDLVVEIYLKSTPYGQTLYVRDNGIGIAPKYQEKIFVLFETMGHAASGSGVGLTIVKSAMERQGGRVTLESDEGAGSVFGLCFPAEEG